MGIEIDMHRARHIHEARYRHRPRQSTELDIECD